MIEPPSLDRTTHDDGPALEDHLAYLNAWVDRRRELVDMALAGEDFPFSDWIQGMKNGLQRACDYLDAIHNRGDARFSTHSGMPVRANVSYEREEFHRDLAFVVGGEEAVVARLREQHKQFVRQVDELAYAIIDFSPDHWITDRDGTVNRYAPLYGSSHQGAYNGIFLGRFIRSFLPGGAAVLTSGPLANPGVMELSCFGRTPVVLAASKGREIVDPSGQRSAEALGQREQQKLDELHGYLEAELQREEFAPMRYVGSGLQVKYGQLTIAYQDQEGSIPFEISRKLYQRVMFLVDHVDPQTGPGRSRCFFHIEDTGVDLEIILHAGNSGGSAPGDRTRDFNKGDGVASILEHTGWSPGRMLLSGDTPSDFPMHRGALESGMTDAFFVYVHPSPIPAGDQEILSAFPKHRLVASPDILVAALNKVAFLKKKT